MEWLFEPLTITVVIGLAALGFVLSLVRGYAVRDAALVAIGIVIAMGGIRWATVLGGDAGLAALITALGAVVWALAVERGRRSHQTAAAQT